MAAWPLLREPGLLNTRGGGDSPFLLQRLQQLETALRGGHFPVRWMPDANYGYGYPFFNFYAPLSIYIAAVFRFLGFSYIRAIHLAQLAGFLVAAWGVYRLAWGWWRDGWMALLASATYTFAPFHLVNIYVRGDSLAEFWAMAFYPLVLLAAEGVVGCREWSVGCRVRVVVLALAYAGLILSHNISALIFSPFLLLYLLLRWLNLQSPISNLSTPHAPRPTPHTLLALLLAFALAAWFFLPALWEQSLAQLEPVTAGYFHYNNHFRGLDLVQTSWLFDYTVGGGRAFRMGLVQGLTAVSGLLLLLLNRQERKEEKSPHLSAFVRVPFFPIATLLIATFMITPWSRWLWDHLPLLPFTQFPWRFLSVQALGAALVTAGLARLPGRQYLVPLLLGLLLWSSLGNLPTDHLIVTDADITAEKLAQYEWFTGNIGSTVSFEYLPPSVGQRPFSSDWLVTGERNRAMVLGGRGAGEVVERRATRQVWRVVVEQDDVVRFPTLFWPGWRAAVDGEQVEIVPTAGSGLISVPVPAGQHTVELWLGRTTVRLVAELVSLTAVLLTLFLLLWRVNLTAAGGGIAIVVVGLLLLAGLAQLTQAEPLSPDNLTWDFAQMGYLHHDTDGVAFEDGSRLVSYRYRQEEVAAGETWEVAVSVAAAQTGELTLTLATPAITWPAVTEQSAVPPLAVQTVRVAESPGDTTAVFSLQIPANAPANLYVPRLEWGNGRPLLPSGKTRGPLFLRPLRVTNDETGSAALDVRADEVVLTDEGLVVKLVWGTERPLNPNYNVALRLLTPTGLESDALDTQPGYGLLPSSGWQPGAAVHDWLTLPLPYGLREERPLALLARLYDVATGEVVLVRRLGELTGEADNLQFVSQQPRWSLPEELGGETAVFRQDNTDLIRMHGYTVTQEGDKLVVTLAWEALAPMAQNYTRFFHIVAADGGVMAQVDGYPLNHSYPTSQWQVGEIVVDQVVLLPMMDYALQTGFYLNDGAMLPRLTAVSPDGTPFPNNAVSLKRE
ncbi:MAG: hypothetical protein KC423_05830 [Anaerolineales bacterium]|nr:hypothetical protein [Anaerolineales bacterium]